MEKASKTILIVDDEYDILSSLEMVFTAEGFSVRTAHDGKEALEQLAKVPVPIIIVLHIPGDQPSLLAELFGSKTEMRVKDADEKEIISPGTIYFASPGYHLLVECDLSFSLSREDPVQYSRPSIDVLFESAADAFGSHLVGVLLTGANQDGAEGLKQIHQAGGLALVQDPATAQVRAMPDAGYALLSATINLNDIDEHILSLDEIGHLLMELR